MTDAVILEEPYGSVLVDARVPCVIVQFHGFANKTQFMHAMETGLAYYVQYSTPARPWGWIGDVRHMSPIPK
ncbi:hypothetical protein [Hymenobacter sp. YC55]|uniref:hypothetical protein n=1 Tax=Hymenobacter sp. YC55 TaxID=3034019 RepID=UPI0023F7D982|nr:hypothetical protein [Hymenobacter sp. YC55]MDF7815701.1 hypothetical protein [Hymenobacter sp. YC55]